MDTKERLQLNRLYFLKSVWTRLRLRWDLILLAWIVLCLFCGGIWYGSRWISPQEQSARQTLVQTAQNYLGCNESDGSHEKIIDAYNAFEPNPRDYKVTYEDNWCATFGSAVALEAGMTDIIPMECSCEQQINLFKALDRWREDECYLPRTGDYIYYVWDEWRSGDCTAWADHVGIVVDTFGPVIQVIEGNKDDAVEYRYIFVNDICIRGFGLPDYKQSE